MARKTSSRVTYAVHPAVEHAKKIIANLPEKTGKTLKQWLALVAKSGLDSNRDIKSWLKAEHQLGGTTAMLIADQFCGKDTHLVSDKTYLAEAPRLVDEMYAGRKEPLRKINDVVIEMSIPLGPELRISPCKTFVPLYRNHVFAQIKPTTQTRVDLGLALKNYSKHIPKLLIDTGGLAKGDRITHRIALASVEDVNDDVQRWLSIAWELDAA